MTARTWRVVLATTVAVVITGCGPFTVGQLNPSPKVGSLGLVGGIDLLIHQQVPDAFQVPQGEYNAIGGSVTAWRTSLHAGFRNGFGDQVSRDGKGRYQLRILQCLPVLAPTLVSAQHGALQVTGKITFHAQLVAAEGGAVVASLSGAVRAKLKTGSPDQIPQLFESAIESMYEEIVNHFQASAAEAIRATSAPGCQNDQQCKGDRICRNGRCDDPGRQVKFLERDGSPAPAPVTPAAQPAARPAEPAAPRKASSGCQGFADCSALCARGHSPSCTRVAVAYLYGDGTGKDASRGLTMLARSCDELEASACRILGELHLLGRGVPKDESRAQQLLGKACENGDTDACARRKGGK